MEATVKECGYAEDEEGKKIAIGREIASIRRLLSRCLNQAPSFRTRTRFCRQGVLAMTPTEEATTGSLGLGGTATRQSAEADETATGKTGVVSASAGQPGEGEAGPDGGEVQGMRRRGERERGAGGVSTDTLEPLGGEGKGSGGEQQVAPLREALLSTSKGVTRENRRVG